MSETLPEVEVVRVILIDSQQMVVEGIKTLLKGAPHICVVAQAGDELEALRRVQEYPNLQVAVVDLNMPETPGVALMRKMRQVAPNLRILALSQFHDYGSVTQVLSAGGAGYLLKSSSKQELIDALVQVASGRNYFSPEVGATLLQNLRFPEILPTTSPDERPVELTSREKEILQLIASEYSNLNIAEKLFIGERTVETHRRNILTKTKTKSVIGLIQYALRHKLIQ